MGEKALSDIPGIHPKNGMIIISGSARVDHPLFVAEEDMLVKEVRMASNVDILADNINYWAFVSAKWRNGTPETIVSFDTLANGQGDWNAMEWKSRTAINYPIIRKGDVIGVWTQGLGGAPPPTDRLAVTFLVEYRKATE